MRSLLELLGILDPEHARREPLALPAWSRRWRPLLVAALAGASMLVFTLVRALAG